MKKILLIFILIFSFVFNAKAQFPLTQTLGSPNTQVYSKGGLGADSGFVFRMNFTDTSVLNLGFLKNIPGLQIRVGDNIWMRNNAATAWLQVGKSLKYLNGLTLSADTVRWGGVLTDSTIINQNGNYVKFVGGNVGINTTGAPLRRFSIGADSPGGSPNGVLHIYASDGTSSFIESSGANNISIRAGNTIFISPNRDDVAGQIVFSEVGNNNLIEQGFLGSGGVTRYGKIGLEQGDIANNIYFFYLKSQNSDTISSEIALYDKIRLINIPQADSNNKILTIDATNNRIRWRDASTIGGGGAGRVYATNGLTTPNDSTVALGGTLTDTTTINIPTGTRFRLLANGANGYMEDNQKPAWFVFKARDTINSNTYSEAGAALLFQRDVFFDISRRDYHRGFDFVNLWKTDDSVRIRTFGGDFGYSMVSTLDLTRDAGTDTRTVFQGGTVDFDAVPNVLSWSKLRRPTGHSNPIRARGWWSGFTAYPINVWGADTLDNYIAFASFGQIGASAKVLKYYDFYAAGGGYSDTRVDSAWSLFSNREKQRVYHAGPVAFGGGNTGPTEALELVGNFKHFNLRSSNAANDSMVVWNEIDKMYGKRPIPSVGSSPNLANTDLTQTAARVFDHDGNSLYWENGGETRWYGSGTYSSERIMEIEGATGRWAAGRLSANKYFEITDSIRAIGLDVSNDTTTRKIVTINPVGGALTYSNWVSGGGGGTPAGSNGQIQFNNSGEFGASSNLTWDNTNARLGIGAPAFTSGENLGVKGTTGSLTSVRFYSPDGGDYIRFGADNSGGHIFDWNGTMSFRINNTQHAVWSSTSYQFNTGLANTDFRISGDNETNLFYSDASADAIGIGTSAPTERLTISGGQIRITGINTASTHDSVVVINNGVLESSPSVITASGTYTPTSSAVSGGTVTSVQQFMYSRVGNVVTYSGYVSVTPTSGGSLMSFNLSLPIASNFTGDYDAAGVANATLSDFSNGSVFSDATNDAIVVKFIGGASSSAGCGIRITGQYVIK